MGEYQDGGEENQLEPQWDQIQCGGKDREVFVQVVLPGDAELLVGQRPPEQPRPLGGLPPQHRRAGVCGNQEMKQKFP